MISISIPSARSLVCAFYYEDYGSAMLGYATINEKSASIPTASRTETLCRFKYFRKTNCIVLLESREVYHKAVGIHNSR